MTRRLLVPTPTHPTHRPGRRASRNAGRRARPPQARLALALLAVLPTLLADPASHAAPPEEGECPSISAKPGEEGGVDAAPLILREGMVVTEEGLLKLRSLLPMPVWQHREVFFYEGMRMLIGPCHRRFRAAPHYAAATEKFRGQPALDKHGNLKNYTAGLPFPPENIAEDDANAGLKWAWNFAKRHRGPGHRGSLRITSMPGRVGGVHRYRGRFFVLKTAERSDLAEEGYALPDAEDKLWAAGGEFTAPYSTRELAWRQFRKKQSQRKWRDADDIFVYVPTMRKMRRAAANWVDGIYVPNFRVAGQYAGGGAPIGDAGAFNPTAAASISATEDARAGLTGLTLRPNAYRWRLRGEQTVLAPLNVFFAGYPQDPERNYGTSGLSVASDVWDIRHAVVIEGALREENETIRTLTVWLDYQTQQPLYWITRASKRRLLDVGILVHRFSDDVKDYPRWPDGSLGSVFEPVAATFYNALAGGGGWMRESYDLRSLPFEGGERRQMMTADPLQRGR